MKNICIIIAGGVGKRMGYKVPKQYFKVFNKEIILYTLENFNKHSLIDEIYVVAAEKYHNHIGLLAKKYCIKKFKGCFVSGDSAQESICNGVFSLYKIKYNSNYNIIIQDAIRPITDSSIITSVIETCNKFGNGVTSVKFTEQMFLSKDFKTTDKYLPRDQLVKISTPQCYKMSLIYNKYKEAKKKNVGFGESSYTNTLMSDLGVKLYLALGSSTNIKLTTKEDLELFKMYVKTNVK